MLALKSIKDILKFMGLVERTDETNSSRYVKNILITIPMVVLLLPLCAYILTEANNLRDVTEVFYVIAATIMCIGQYWFLVAQKKPLENLISELQTLIDQSKCLNCLFLLVLMTAS